MTIRIEIPVSIFRKRIEKVKRSTTQRSDIVHLIEELLSVYSSIDRIVVRNTFDMTQIQIGATIIDYHDSESRKWLNQYLTYPVREDEIENETTNETNI